MALVGPCGLWGPVLCYLSLGMKRELWPKNRPTQNKGKLVSAPPPQGRTAIASRGNAEMVKEMKSRLYIASLWETVKVPLGRLHSQVRRCVSPLPTSPPSGPGPACLFSRLLHPPSSYHKGDSPPSLHMGGQGGLERKGYYNCWLGGSWPGSMNPFRKYKSEIARGPAEAPSGCSRSVEADDSNVPEQSALRR